MEKQTEKEVIKDIFNRIISYTNSKGITRSDLLQKTGISKPTFYKWKSGNVSMSMINYLKICKGLNVPYSYFFKDITEYSENYISANNEVTEPEVRHSNDYVDEMKSHLETKDQLIESLKKENQRLEKELKEYSGTESNKQAT